ncbi:hypothetical protein JOC85_004361 [Bacillus mesophilus]|uniref:Uncharacterized protein n=1 Tax=Bacillus mesophilus TaxID=1808955 RepID=A0A6M0QCY4_9BACI|nr:DUF2161 family putative PD-(D/E)XK-type phosphodiesterase [Bacillus mesophilus]MBM7663485.1 hypothetical protein [Bacillus mesophilus]NEY74166.1 hypothetical protein [Bacillus mesophilus]
MTEKKKLQEIDLYKPIQRYFVKEGYEVYGEVNDCDLAAVKEDELVVVELKLNLSVDLLVQATKRQRLTDSVYIAVPKPKYKLRSKKWTDLCHLVRRLELGLIIVSFSGNRKNVEVIFEPTPFERKKSRNNRKRNRVLKEISGRSADYNIGGSSRTKIITAYKENCIQIACYLQRYGDLSPKALRELGTGNKTSSILTKNYYGWFERVQRGVYTISEKGKKELNENSEELLSYYKEMVKEKEIHTK